ncbi:MAG: hypothetical protein JHC98_09400 [Thermoleophilaceae bacterium]|nr:hypothetical protein [Thermoleophilaceae bacterium]
MNDQTDPAAKADAVRAREEAARKKARKNTIVFGLAMFGIVFALLSFQYVTGSDPSLRQDSLSAQSETAQPREDDDEGWEWQDDDEGEDDDGGWQQPQLPQNQSAPPTSGAS